MLRSHLGGETDDLPDALERSHVRHDADVDLFDGEPCLSTGHSDIGGTDEIDSTTDARAVDGGDDGLGDILYSCETGLIHLCEISKLYMDQNDVGDVQ